MWTCGPRIIERLLMITWRKSRDSLPHGLLGKSSSGKLLRCSDKSLPLSSCRGANAWDCLEVLEWFMKPKLTYFVCHLIVWVRESVRGGVLGVRAKCSGRDNGWDAFIGLTKCARLYGHSKCVKGSG